MEIRRDDLEFLLFEWLEVAGERDAHLAVLDQAERLSRDYLAEHAAKSDAHEPHTVDGEVVLIPEIKTALDALAAAGFFAISAPLEHGGLALPQTIVSACLAIFSARNAPTYAYVMLTVAAANLLATHGSEELKARYLQPMLQGDFFGTMCLSEPHAGSSVGDIRTVAVLKDDDCYHLRGSKMWISGGEHAMSSNICHFVLAKIPGGPAGTKGISLFLVPRLMEDGSRNGIELAGINHKLGYRGTVNCLLNLGETTACVGYLVGEVHGGIRAMFTMMNEARIGVGTGAAAMGYAAFRVALGYARERQQGRSVQQSDPSRAQVRIVEHSDVKRMLVQAKAYAEGALALCLYASKLLDEEREGRADSGKLLALLIPIVKAWPSEFALAANDLAIQVLGGAGYTRDFPVERLWRDNRLNAIHEGTNGIQGLDLLARKVIGDRGDTLKMLARRMQDTVAKAAYDPELAPLGGELANVIQDIVRISEPLILRAAFNELEIALGNSSQYLSALGHTVVAWLWLDIALRAKSLQSASGSARSELLEGKIVACRYFFRWELPSVRSKLELIGKPDRLVLDIDERCL